MWEGAKTLATQDRFQGVNPRAVSMAIKFYLALLLCTALPASADDAQALMIWFDQPASDWEREGLPIGNGAMGAVIQGGIESDIIQFNEKTLWTGGPGSASGYDFGWPKASRADALARVRKTLEQKGTMAPEEVAGQLGNKISGYGDYQTFGDVVMTFPAAQEVSNYRRELDLAKAMVRVSYRSGDVNYTREYFASYPDGVIVTHVSADKPGMINLSAHFSTPDNRQKKIVAAKGRIALSGHLKDNGLQFDSQLQVIADGGKLSTAEKEGVVTVANADSVLLILSAGSNYALEYPGYRGQAPHANVAARVDNASKKTYSQLVTDHQADYRALFDRVDLSLNHAVPDQPTHKTLTHYGTGDETADRALEVIYFQYGRYLLIASSRAGSLPANLQGVWNNSVTPPWNADYHVNINLQMNYWPADVTNLSETTGPLFDFVDSLVEPGRISAKKILGVNGWTLFLNTNIWGFTGVIEWPTAFWQPEAGAWLAQHYYEHYLFTGDEKFLRERAYPLMKGAAEFWLDALVKDSRDGLLVVSPSYSPEQGEFTVAAAMSQRIVFDLFTNTFEAADVLGDKSFRKTLGKNLMQLDKGVRVGSWGQLQEWKLDLDDPANNHRHVSHLFALHPGHQINNIESSELLEAARVSLNARGDGGTGWAQAWKINLWARLLDGNRAHKLLGDQLKASTLPNLWDNHPPFQIDGNFGATAGIAEMLLQSQNHEIYILPALPKAWPKGAIKGLRARGNVTVDMTWADSQLQTARILAGKSGMISLRSPVFSGEFTLLNISTGKAVAVKGDGESRRFNAQAGEAYLLTKVSLNKNNK
jgi:alpha-L-fucosidase 2